MKTKTNKTQCPRKCLRPDCNNSPWSRGLCKGCYASARKLVADGKTTWADLEKRGKCKHAVEMHQIAKWLMG